MNAEQAKTIASAVDQQLADFRRGLHAELAMQLRTELRAELLSEVRAELRAAKPGKADDPWPTVNSLARSVTELTALQREAAATSVTFAHLTAATTEITRQLDERYALGAVGVAPAGLKALQAWVERSIAPWMGRVRALENSMQRGADGHA